MTDDRYSEVVQSFYEEVHVNELFFYFLYDWRWKSLRNLDMITEIISPPYSTEGIINDLSNPII